MAIGAQGFTGIVDMVAELITDVVILGLPKR